MSSQGSKPVALEAINFGRHGEIQAGEEIPATFIDSRGVERDTDFASLAARGLVKPPTAKRKPPA